MFQSMQNRRDRNTSVFVDIAPLIDIVFILLIFFLVTATFVRDTGVEVERPRAVMAQAIEPTSMRISITATGAIHTEGQPVTLDELAGRVSGFMSRDRNGSVIVIPDRAVPAGRLIEVMDVARQAGAKDVVAATTRE